MSSYKLQAKNKKTNEIFTVHAIDDYYGKHKYGYSIVNGDTAYTEEQFNELYERVEETCNCEEKSCKAGCTKKHTCHVYWCDKCGESRGLATTNKGREYQTPSVEEDTPEWEIDLEKQFGHWDIPTTPIKFFIHDTLKAERERIVREIENMKKCNHCKVNDGQIIVSRKKLVGGGESIYYSCNPCNTLRHRVYRNKEGNMKIIYNGIKRYIERNKEKQSAWQKVFTAKKKGLLTVPTHCSACGHISKLDAHHADYSKPLDVIFLCRPCHHKVS